MDDNKDTTAEAEVRKALAGLQATNAALRAELDAVKGKMTEERARIAFTEAMEKADARPQAKEFGLKLLKSELRNIRLTDDGEIVASLGDLEGATPEELVKSFIAANEFLQKVVTADGLDVTPMVAEPTDVSALATDSLGNAIPMHELSSDELFHAAGLPPEAPPPKRTRARALSESDRELSSDELFQRAGEAPWER
jgi:hypothetical protein